MPNIAPCLWFDGAAEQAAAFYAEVFPDSEILSTSRYGPDMPGPEGSVMTVEFTLAGQKFLGLNGGPQFPFTEAVSFQIFCADQAEIDYYWDRLAEGGEESVCGWLKDRFGLSWQVVPSALTALVGSVDQAQSQRVMQAVMGMKKFDIAEILRAAGPV